MTPSRCHQAGEVRQPDTSAAATRARSAEDALEAPAAPVAPEMRVRNYRHGRGRSSRGQLSLQDRQVLAHVTQLPADAVALGREGGHQSRIDGGKARCGHGFELAAWPNRSDE